MEGAFLHSLVTVESAPATWNGVPMPQAVPKAVHRVYPGAPEKPDSIDLPRISRPATYHGAPSSGQTTPSTDIDVEMIDLSSNPTAPDNGVEALQTVWDPYRNRYRLLACSLIIFQNGMNDSGPGALIPYMEEYYHIGYAVVSLIFVGNAVGFIAAVVFTDAIRERVGRAGALIFSQALMVAGYLPVVCGAPFPVLVPAYFLLGLGMSITVAIANIFCGSLQNDTTMLGIVHGSYGIGGTIGPLIATALVTVARTVWSRYYLITLGLAVFNGGFAGWAFWGYERECRRHALGRVDTAHSAASTVPVGPTTRERLAGMLAAFRSRVVVLGALFIFAYQGAEVSISGWVISFLITWRHGNPSSVGYVTAGFWAGITLGRFVLSAPCHRIGEKAAVYVLVAGAAVFELLVWLVPNVVGNAVAVAIVGLLLGPVYTCATAVFIRCLNRSEMLTSLSLISAFGSSGGAVAPFTTGILAQAAGTFVLHPIAIGLFACMLVCWFWLPSVRKRTE